MTAAPADRTLHADLKPPGFITAARLLMAVVATSHLVIPIVMLTRRSALEHQIAGLHPTMSAPDVSHSTSMAVEAAVGFHAALLVLSVVLIVRLPGMASRILRLAIVSQLAGVVFSVVSWLSSSMFHGVIPVLDVVQLAVVACCVAAWPHRRRPNTAEQSASS